MTARTLECFVARLDQSRKPTKAAPTLIVCKVVVDETQPAFARLMTGRCYSEWFDSRGGRSPGGCYGWRAYGPTAFEAKEALEKASRSKL